MSMTFLQIFHFLRIFFLFKRILTFFENNTIIILIDCIIFPTKKIIEYKGR